MLKSAALFCFPWDFQDEGLDALVKRARDLGVTHLAVATSYHAGFFLHPHNPKRKVHLLEDGVVYFHPDERCYADGPIRPAVAAMCRSRDWIGAICEAAHGAGLKVIAWTVLLHNTRIGLAHPQATICNAFGDSYPHALSPAHPASVALARGLVRDLAGRYPFDAILLEAPNYRGRAHGGAWVSGHHHERTGTHLRPLEMRLMDLSFNDADIEQAEAAGLDVQTLRSAVQHHLTRYFDEAPDVPGDLPATIEQFKDQHPALCDYETHCRRVEHALLAKLCDDARPHGVKLIGPADPAIDIVLAGVYGQPLDRVSQITRSARAALLPHQELMVALRMGFASPGMGDAIVSERHMAEVTRAIGDEGADIIGYYNYAEAPIRCVNWIKAALGAKPVAAPRSPSDKTDMQYNRLGKTELRVSRICFGTAFRSELDEQTCIDAIHTAAELGCNFLDCANMYRDGESERIVGKAVEGRRDQFVICTKVGSAMPDDPSAAGLGRDNILTCCEASLRRLNTDYLDCYLCHFPDPLTPIDETLDGFDQLIRQGKVRYAGCCNFPTWRLHESLRAGEQRNLPRFACIQMGYSLLDRRIEDELAPFCEDHGVGITVYAPTAIGLLTGRYRYGQPPPEGTPWHRGPYNYPRAMTPHTGRVIDAVIEVAARHGKTPTQVAIAWCLRLATINAVIMGTDTPQQARENFLACDWRLPEEDQSLLDHVCEGARLTIHKDCPAGYPDQAVNST